MKKIVLSLILLALTSTMIQAQNPHRKMRSMQRSHHPMAWQKPDLTDEQKKKFRTLNEDYRKNLMDLRKKEDITVKEWKTKMAELHKKRHSDLQNLYTPEQKAKLEKMKRERNQMAEINSRARMDRMTIQLGLSREQTEKLNAQRYEMQEKMKALRENKSMDMQKKREEIKALMEKRKENMNSILTIEQKKKIKEIKMRHPRKPGKLS